MRRSTVIAIRNEIERLLYQVTLLDKRIQRVRDNLVLFHGDPVDGELVIQNLLKRKNGWQEAVNRRVLQLARMDSGVGIKTTFRGSLDPFLVSEW